MIKRTIGLDAGSVSVKYAILDSECNIIETKYVRHKGNPLRVVYDLLKQAEVFAIPGDSSITPKGEKIIFYVHTDRISLIDQEGRIRKHYSGSKIKVEEIVADIKSLTN